MPMRLSGLISGMDTESVIAELMKAQRLKTTKLENKITTTEWKQEKWSALNSKIYSFYTKQLSKISMQGSFAAKKATSSNSNKVDIKAGTGAPEGTHLIKVKQLASSQFVTGAKLGKDKNGKEISTSTKLTDLGFSASEGTTIHIKANGKEVNLDVRKNTTVGDLIASMRNAGLNASYDEAQKRFFVSSKASGAENAFEITTSSSEHIRDKNLVRDFLSYDSLNSADKKKVDKALNDYLNDTLVEEDREAIRNELLKMKHAQVREKYISDYMADADNIAAVTSAVEERLKEGLEEGETLDENVLKAAVKDQLKQDAEMAVFTEYEAWENGSAADTNVFKAAEAGLNTLMNDYVTDSGDTIVQSGSLAGLGLGEIVKDEDGVVSVNGNPNAVLIEAADAVIIYNGAEMTGSSNNFSVNGLTLDLKGVTDDNEVISLAVSSNTEAVYDMVKDFVKAYNELLNEMNGAYNAKSARGYDPLTDEERAAMTEEQITKWEDRIKESLLRRDDTLSSLISVFRSTMSEGVTVNGKTYSLASFGITSPDYTERGLLHIRGDEDDPTMAAFENQLMEALTNNPDEVMAVMNKLGEKLHDSLMDKMKSTTLSSALTVYNDKEMSKTLTDYKSDLKKLEDKLLDIENKYYKQFAAMETAMARMNSQSSALMSMLGMNNQQQ